MNLKEIETVFNQAFSPSWMPSDKNSPFVFKPEDPLSPEGYSDLMEIAFTMSKKPEEVEKAISVMQYASFNIFHALGPDLDDETLSSIANVFYREGLLQRDRGNNIAALTAFQRAINLPPSSDGRTTSEVLKSIIGLCAILRENSCFVDEYNWQKICMTKSFESGIKQLYLGNFSSLIHSAYYSQNYKDLPVLFEIYTQLVVLHKDEDHGKKLNELLEEFEPVLDSLNNSHEPE